MAPLRFCRCQNSAFGYTLPMKKFTLLLVLAGSIVLFGCGKKEAPPVEEPKSVKVNLQAASSNVNDAAVEFKKVADEAARDVGEALQDFKIRIDGAFQKAKDNLEK